MLRLRYGGGQLIALLDHLFLCADGTLVRAGDLVVGDRLRLASGGETVVEEIATLEMDGFAGPHHHLSEGEALILGDLPTEA